MIFFVKKEHQRSILVKVSTMDKYQTKSETTS